MDYINTAIYDLGEILIDLNQDEDRKVIASKLRQTLDILKHDCMDMPHDCFGYPIQPYHRKYVKSGDPSKQVHLADVIALDEKEGEWVYFTAAGESWPCKEAYPTDNIMAIIESEITEFTDLGSASAHRLARRIFAKFPR